MKSRHFAVVSALLCLVGAGSELTSGAFAHEGYPIALEAKYAEIQRGAVVRRMVFVTGHAHYPDGTLIKVGWRPEGARSYIDWFPAVVRRQAFAVDVGPYMKEFASGEYIVEAWFRFREQSRAVQEAIRKSQEGAEGGVGICPAERVAAQLPCLLNEVFGATILTIGTTGRAIFEEQAAREFFERTRDLIRGILDEVRSDYAQHAERGKSPEHDSEAWQANVGQWSARVQEIDAALLQWNNAKVNPPHRPAYQAATTALVNVEALLASCGRELYNLEVGFPGGSPESLVEQVSTNLQQVTDELGR